MTLAKHYKDKEIVAWQESDILREYGFNPKIPQNYEGMRILPPMSAPKPNKEHFRAIIPPSPPELPPVDLNLFQGLRDLPQRLFAVSIVILN